MTRNRGRRGPAGAPDACPCGTGRRYADCCQPLHLGHRAAATAEGLMRSRYSAFALGDTTYLLETWHPANRPPLLRLDPRQRWTRLEVLATSGESVFGTSGTVEFRAYYRSPDGAGVLHECSQFLRVDGRWYYLGAVPEPAGGTGGS